jgi:hypothetical protein
MARYLLGPDKKKAPQGLFLEKAPLSWRSCGSAAAGAPYILRRRSLHALAGVSLVSQPISNGGLVVDQFLETMQQWQRSYYRDPKIKNGVTDKRWEPSNSPVSISFPNQPKKIPSFLEWLKVNYSKFLVKL